MSSSGAPTRDQTPQAQRVFPGASISAIFAKIKRLRAGDHTGQLSTDERREREDRFRADWYLDEAKKAA